MNQGRSHVARIKEYAGISKNFTTNQSKKKELMEEVKSVKVASVDILKILSRKNRVAGIEEGLNGCITDSLSQSL